ncbi:hypothetical protein LXA20_17570, partial [Erwinia amylovora]|uniref:hypothetical protein n=1 Tax=Erwinia amylovora TaxID=552 RepID=UPI0020BF72DE
DGPGDCQPTRPAAQQIFVPRPGAPRGHDHHGRDGRRLPHPQSSQLGMLARQSGNMAEITKQKLPKDQNDLNADRSLKVEQHLI